MRQLAAWCTLIWAGVFLSGNRADIVPFVHAGVSVESLK